MAAALELSSNDIWGLCQRYLKEFPHDSQEKQQQQLDNFKIVSYKLKPISEDPSGFLGCHQFLIVEVLTTCSATKAENIQQLRFFTKTAPVEIESRMQYLEGFGVFQKEIVVYRDLLPKLQSTFGAVAPQCYYSDNNMLVFEDLSQQGFKMAAGRDGLLDFQHLQCSVKTLAALHASSIVLDFKQKAKINELFPKAVFENAYPANCSPQHVRYKNFANANKVFCEIIKELPKYQNIKLKYILENIQPKMARIFELVQPSNKYYNVFSHADLWANNVMFQYGKYGNIPQHARFVDFQLSRYAPPILDLITILTIPSTQAFRSKYLMDLIMDYYRFMTEFLRREQLDIEQILPMQDFLQSVDEYRICGLIESCLFSHLTILPGELTQSLTGTETGFNDFFDSKRVEICMKAFHSDEVYRQRLTDMLEDFVDNYVLK